MSASFDEALPLVDLRPADRYAAAHFRGATHLPWPDLKERLSELPPRPSDLQLVGNAASLHEACAFLNEKGYTVVHTWDETAYLKELQKSPGLGVSGMSSKRLWQPNPLLVWWLEWLQQSTSPQKVWDIGCGGGRDAVYLALQGFDVTAIDQQEAVLSRARRFAERQNASVDWKCCSVDETDCLPNDKVDVVVMMRYLNRCLLSQLHDAIRPGGFVVMQTFVSGVEAFGSPKNPNFILQPDELAKTFSDFDVIVDRIETLPDGRPVSSFIGRKPSQ
ncbi:MAG: methyltransferase domain-containing protein [Hydrogenovibrio sp.]